MLALFAVPIAAGQEKLDYGRILRRGCSADQLAGNVWRTYVWADYQDGAQKHDFPLWLSERGNRWQALKDCEDWRTSMDKKQAKTRKPNSQTTGDSNRSYRREAK